MNSYPPFLLLMSCFTPNFKGLILGQFCDFPIPLDARALDSKENVLVGLFFLLC